MPSVVTWEPATEITYASSMTRTARPSAIAAMRSKSTRRRLRDNWAMAAVSQTLIEFARNHRARPAPGVEVIVTPRYQITLQPDFPVPGPNNVSWIRCRVDEVDGVVREVRATIGPRRLPFMWTLDPGAEPHDLAARLAKHGINPDPHGEEATVMVLPADAPVEMPDLAGLEIHDALVDAAAFMDATNAAAEAFDVAPFGNDPGTAARQERRRTNLAAAGNSRLLLATIDGEPAGSGSLTLFPPEAAMINGGSVRPKFRGRGVYRALVAARLEIARREGAGGLVVWGGAMSAPILARLGFEPVSWRRFYVDASAAEGS
jgi:GNAT superfamily N-acetyltransferase